MYTHMRKVHKMNLVTKPKKLMCSECKILVSSYDELRQHFVNDHNEQITIEVKAFDSKEEFLNWKEQKEKELKCLYVPNTGKRENSKCTYVCHRSRKSACPKNDRKRQIKNQSTVEVNYTCPSTLELSKADNYKATLFLPHIGHVCSLKHTNLTLTERKQIAENILKGDTFEEILDNLRNSVTSDIPLERIHLIDQQDLRNIIKEFELQDQLKNNENYSINSMIYDGQTSEHIQNTNSPENNYSTLKIGNALVESQTMASIKNNEFKQLIKSKLKTIHKMISTVEVDEETGLCVETYLNNCIELLEESCITFINE